MVMVKVMVMPEGCTATDGLEMPFCARVVESGTMLAAEAMPVMRYRFKALKNPGLALGSRAMRAVAPTMAEPGLMPNHALAKELCAVTVETQSWVEGSTVVVVEMVIVDVVPSLTVVVVWAITGVSIAQETMARMMGSMFVLFVVVGPSRAREEVQPEF